MKKIFFIATVLLFIGFIFSSCKKDNPVNSAMTTVRYEFTSDVNNNYNLRYTADTAVNFETVSSGVWSKTIAVKPPVNSASITVYTPAAWVGTSMQANATLKIFVNDVEKVSESGILNGNDRPAGLTATTMIQ